MSIVKMSRNQEQFKFKHFSVNHSISSMKIGIDAVLLGAWIDPSGLDILDVGCGCGVISLMVAQRNSCAKILAIDIHKDSVTEAQSNFVSSQWRDRLKAVEMDYMCMQNDMKFDLIVSNPPYFSSGIVNPETPRLIARHESLLSPGSLLKKGRNILNPNGRIAVIIPTERENGLLAQSNELGYVAKRILRVSGREGKPFNRTLIEFVSNTCLKTGYSIDTQELYIRDSNGEYSDAYKDLCKGFYLKF